MNNIFLYSPKELTTDAFLQWLFVTMSIDNELKVRAGEVFYQLGVVDDPTVEINLINVTRQEKNTDLVVRFLYGGVKYQCLFENKTYSTIHSNQLAIYKGKFPDFDRYIFLKLGQINYKEKKLAKKSGYKVLSALDLNNAIFPLSNYHFLIKHYLDFLEYKYLVQQRDIEDKLIHENEISLFDDSGQAQQFFLSKLHEKLDGVVENIDFKYSSSSGGAPWVQLTIVKRAKAYDKKTESIFWRIDKRKGGYYLRLTQYSDIEKKFKSEKQSNLEILRKTISSIIESEDLVFGKASSKGLKSSEVFIIFFKDNNVSELLRALPRISVKIVNAYKSIKKWV